MNLNLPISHFFLLAFTWATFELGNVMCVLICGSLTLYKIKYGMILRPKYRQTKWEESNNCLSAFVIY